MDETNPLAALGLGGMMAASSGNMDALAKAHGFANAQQMADFYAQQQRRTGQNGTGAPVAAQQKIAQPMPQQQGSWLQQLLGAKLFNNILSKWNGATGGQ